MKESVFAGCAGVCLLALLVRAFGVRRRSAGPSGRGGVVLGVYAALLVTFTLAIPTVSAYVDRALGVNNIAAFFITVALLLTASLLRTLILCWLIPPAEALRRSRTYYVVLAALLPVLAFLFLESDNRERSRDFLMQNAGQPLIACYLVLYTAALATSFGLSAYYCLRFQRHAGSPWLRYGLRLFMCGAVLGIGYCATRLSDMVARVAGADPSTWEFLVPVFGGVGGIVGVTGLMLPAVGAQADAMRARLRLCRRYRATGALWRELRAEFPALARERAPGVLVTVLPLRALRRALYQRTITVFDGMLAIRPWIPAPDTGPGDGDAAATATRLRAALDAKRRGAPARDIAAAGTADAGPAAGGTLTVTAPAAADAEWLALVGEAFTRLRPEGRERGR